ncbi:MAG: hypothetical protein R3A12_07045 [Ignavibacteria bacterium]
MAGSPLINAGTPIAGITTDIDGQTRSVTTPPSEQTSCIYTDIKSEIQL